MFSAPANSPVPSHSNGQFYRHRALTLADAVRQTRYDPRAPEPESLFAKALRIFRAESPSGGHPVPGAVHRTQLPEEPSNV